MRYTSKILAGKSDRKKTTCEKQCQQKGKVKTDLKQTVRDGVDWVQMARRRIQGLTDANMVIRLAASL
jgi:hypothetical protein